MDVFCWKTHRILEENPIRLFGLRPSGLSAYVRIAANYFQEISASGGPLLPKLLLWELTWKVSKLLTVYGAITFGGILGELVGILSHRGSARLRWLSIHRCCATCSLRVFLNHMLSMAVA